MARVTFTYILNQGLGLYRQGRYWEGYQFMTSHAEHVPRNDATVYDFRASLACRAGHKDLALQLLEEAVVQKGCWYAGKYLAEDEDIRPATELPGFERLLDICAERERKALGSARSEMKLVKLPSNGERKPLVIVLHGNMQNVDIAQEDWGTAAQHCDLAFVQSSQESYDGAYVWNDLNKGAEDLKAKYEELRSAGELEGRKVIIAGFSAGARLALHSVLKDTVQVDGAILVGPSLPDLDELVPRLRNVDGRGLCIICGDKDDECLPMAKNLHAALDDIGSPNSFWLVEGMDHDYPADFGDELSEVVRSVTGRGRAHPPS